MTDSASLIISEASIAYIFNAPSFAANMLNIPVPEPTSITVLLNATYLIAFS